MTPQEKNIIAFKLFQQRALALLPAGSKVVLFGSVARGESHEESDVDVLILTRFAVADSIKKAITIAAVEVGMQNSSWIQTVFYQNDVWQQLINMPFQREVNRYLIHLANGK